MAKSLEQLQASKGGSSLESNGFGSQERKQNPSGLYRHEKSGEEIITKWHPLFGSAQADAAVRVGFEWVRDATEEELREQYDFIPTPAAAAPANNDELKGILARLNALEAEKEALVAENAALKGDGEDQSKETKKEDK